MCLGMELYIYLLTARCFFYICRSIFRRCFQKFFAYFGLFYFFDLYDKNLDQIPYELDTIYTRKDLIPQLE
jgi:hypothetical protein